MNHTYHHPAIYLLSPHASNAHPLYQKLQDYSTLTIYDEQQATHYLPLSCYSISPPYLVFVDALYPEKTLFELAQSPLLNAAIATVLFNAPQTPNLTLLSQFPHLSGYFYQHDTPSKWIQHIPAIMEGRKSLPNALLLEIFHYWQRLCKQTSHSHTKIKLSLTFREREILSQLKIGQSNLDIADHFFVSEHTIKSHLYRIFKKLQVKNRRQAIQWAKLYLPSPAEEKDK